MEAQKPPSLAQRLRQIGLTKSHAYMVASGARVPPLPLALRIHRQLGVKLGPIANATDEQIEVLEQVSGERAA